MHTYISGPLVGRALLCKMMCILAFKQYFFGGGGGEVFFSTQNGPLKHIFFNKKGPKQYIFWTKMSRKGVLWGKNYTLGVKFVPQKLVPQRVNLSDMHASILGIFSMLVPCLLRPVKSILWNISGEIFRRRTWQLSFNKNVYLSAMNAWQIMVNFPHVQMESKSRSFWCLTIVTSAFKLSE